MPQSDRQSAASRSNGQKSKGPTTAAGKARSSKNARTHGLTGKLEADPEEAAYIQQLLARLSERFDVKDGNQAKRMQIALHAELRLLRVYALLESQASEMFSTEDSEDEQEQDEAARQTQELASLLMEATGQRRIRASILRMIGEDLGFQLPGGSRRKTRLSTLVVYAQRFRGQRDRALRELQATLTTNSPL